MTDLIKIPGVGPSLKNDLIKLGYTNVESLKNQNPELMFEKLEKIMNKKIDRCVLYVFRCAVCYANNEKENRESLKWWDFKD